MPAKAKRQDNARFVGPGFWGETHRHTGPGRSMGRGTRTTHVCLVRVYVWARLVGRQPLHEPSLNVLALPYRYRTSPTILHHCPGRGAYLPGRVLRVLVQGKVLGFSTFTRNIIKYPVSAADLIGLWSECVVGRTPAAPPRHQQLGSVFITTRNIHIPRAHPSLPPPLLGPSPTPLALDNHPRLGLHRPSPSTTQRLSTHPVYRIAQPALPPVVIHLLHTCRHGNSCRSRLSLLPVSRTAWPWPPRIPTDWPCCC